MRFYVRGSDNGIDDSGIGKKMLASALEQTYLFSGECRRSHGLTLSDGSAGKIVGKNCDREDFPQEFFADRAFKFVSTL